MLSVIFTVKMINVSRALILMDIQQVFNIVVLVLLPIVLEILFKY